MENELTDLIGRKVDLRTPNELSHHFRGTGSLTGDKTTQTLA